MNLLTEFQYFPPYNLYKISNKASNIFFEQYENFQKMSFRNRCQIAGAEGIITLSIPLEKGRDQKALIRDVKIAGSEKWQGQHWKTIVSCYRRSPWFEFYCDELESIYRKPVVFLCDWNITCFEWSLRVLKMPLHAELTGSYQKNYDPGEWLDWRGKLSPKNKTLPGDIKYRQVFEERLGFLPNLSILDLLFCEGKRASELLKS